MRWLISALGVLFAACGPTEAEKKRIAQVTCAIISETRGIGSAERVARVNEARADLNLSPYLDGDQHIVQALKHGLCELLVLDSNWVVPLEERIAEEDRRQAALENAEAQRLAEQELQRQIHRENFRAGKYDEEIKKCDSLYPNDESQRRMCAIIAATTGEAK